MKTPEIPLEVLLAHPKDLQGQIYSYEVILDSGMYINATRKGTRHVEKASYDADVLFQFCLMKAVSILKLAGGVEYAHPSGEFKINRTLEPFSILNIVRAQFEAYCNFNNIYVQSKSQEEIDLKHNLWVLSGLLNRQKFPTGGHPEYDAKKNSDAKKILELKEKIETNKVFLTLDESSKGRITDWNRLTSDWKLVVNSGKAIFVGWRELMINAGTNQGFEHTYRVLSLATHPSNVSIFQYDQLYIQKEEEFMTKMALSFSKWILSFLIHDYINFFKLNSSIYTQLPEVNRKLIEIYNTHMRENNKH